MSAYIVDPRTIDYLVSWAHRHRGDHSCPTAFLPEGTEVPEELEPAVTWLTPGANKTGRLYLAQVSSDDLGKLLMAQNVRSVQHLYSDSADNLPGPIK